MYTISLLSILFCSCTLPVDEVTSPLEWPVTIRFITNELALKLNDSFYDSIKVEITGNGIFEKQLHCASYNPFITTTLPAGPGRIIKATRYSGLLLGQHDITETAVNYTTLLQISVEILLLQPAPSRYDPRIQKQTAQDR
jgi:hypothetical protein